MQFRRTLLTSLAATLLSTGSLESQQITRLSTWQGMPAGATSGMLMSWGGRLNAGQFFESYGFGQSFTVPAGTHRLDEFTMYMAGGDNCESYPVPCDLLVTVSLVRWNPTVGPVGPVLWSSNRSVGPGAYLYSLDPSYVLVNPRVNLSAGMYAALLMPYGVGALVGSTYTGEIWASTTWSSGNSQVAWDWPGGSLISGYSSTGSEADVVWSEQTYMDGSFEATLTETPEPVSLILFGTGLLGLKLRRRRHA